LLDFSSTTRTSRQRMRDMQKRLRRFESNVQASLKMDFFQKKRFIFLTNSFRRAIISMSTSWYRVYFTYSKNKNKYTCVSMQIVHTIKVAHNQYKSWFSSQNKPKRSRPQIIPMWR
jgi:hypothetical protein